MFSKNMYYQKSETRQTKNTSSTCIISAPDKELLIISLFLTVIGFLAIFSATAPRCLDEGGNPAQFLFKQLLAFIIGLVCMFKLSNYDYKKLPKWNNICLITVLVLLAIVKFTPLGMTINGATRWINLFGFQLQPSEMAKPVVAMLLASTFCKDARLLDSQKWISSFIPILIMIGLIFMQPNLSMVLLLLAASCAMFLAAGGTVKLIIALVAPVVLIGPMVIKPYQLSRVRIWLHPEIDPLGAGYNIIQSLIAFATGRFWGEGYGGSIQKLYYLPECHTDFIFAIIGEEMGFVGCLLVIGLFFRFIQRGFKVASKCPDMYGKLLAIGLTFTIGFQAFLNMSVSTSLLPATGVPLPFVSYGGSSLIVSLCMVGILLNISKRKIARIGTTQNAE